MYLFEQIIIVGQILTTMQTFDSQVETLYIVCTDFNELLSRRKLLKMVQM